LTENYLYAKYNSNHIKEKSKVSDNHSNPLVAKEESVKGAQKRTVLVPELAVLQTNISKLFKTTNQNCFETSAIDDKERTNKFRSDPVKSLYLNPSWEQLITSAINFSIISSRFV